MLQSRLRARAVAVVTKPTSNTATPVQDARHVAQNILAMGVIIAVLYFGRLFFITALSAMTIAFILEPFVVLLMRLRLPRSLASFVICSVALALVYVVGLGAYTQFAAMYEDLPKYGERIGDLVDDVRQRIQAMEERTYQVVVPARQR